MPKYVLLTATDTGVGKTWSGVALATALAEAGKKVVAIKPVETGTSVEPDEGEDGVKLAMATGQAAPKHALHRFRTPVSASLAAELSSPCETGANGSRCCDVNKANAANRPRRAARSHVRDV